MEDAREEDASKDDIDQDDLHHTTCSYAQNDPTPTPWALSDEKQSIIGELKDETSDIHLLIGKYTEKNFVNVNFTKIREKYANNNYKASNFRTNMKLQLRHFLKGNGPFVDEEEIVGPWYTSARNVSTGYALLFLLHMDTRMSRIINAMTDEELWESHRQFQLYDFGKFKGYNKNMMKLTSKRKGRISEEQASFNHDMLKLQQKTITAREYPFWNKHPASELLREDELNCTEKQMKPEKLWRSRLEYQDFPLPVFRKHIYQERMKQLAAPYWQHKRNKNAKKKLEEAQTMMKDWQHNQFEKGIGEVLDEWGRFNFEEGNT